MRFAPILVQQGLEEEADPKSIMSNCLRIAFIDMQNVPIVDLALSLEFLSSLDDERKITRYVSRLQETLEVTNPVILKKAYN